MFVIEAWLYVGLVSILLKQQDLPADHWPMLRVGLWELRVVQDFCHWTWLFQYWIVG
jgi:hypothetical protein